MDSRFSGGCSDSPANGLKFADGNYSRPFPVTMWQKAVLFSVAFFLCAEASRFLSVPNRPFAIFWLPAGLYVAVLLLNETRAWPWLILAALPANLAFDLTVGTKPVVILGFFVANTVQAVTGAWLIRRFVAERPILASLKEIFGFVGFSAVLSSVLGATLGAATQVAAGVSHSFAESWNNWWGALAMGILALSPLILTWLSGPDAYHQRLFQQRKLWEPALLVVLSITLTLHLLVFDKGVMSPNKSTLFLPLLWAGLRFGLRGATVVSLVLLALPVTYFTTQYSMGLTPDQVASGEYVSVIQLTLVAASLAGLIPAIVLRERDRKTDDLRESEDRFRSLSEASFEGLMIHDRGVILDVNPAFMRLFGYEKPEELVGKIGIKIMLTPESQARIMQRLQRQEHGAIEVTCVRKNGTTFAAETDSRQIKYRGHDARIVSCHEITERKQAEEAIKTNEERTRLFFERQLVGMAITSPEKGWLQVNDRLCEMLGFSREELVRLTWSELTYSEDLAPDVAQFNRLLAGEINDYTLEKRFVRKDGKVVHANLAVACVRRPDGAVDYVLALLEDITGRKRAEGALRRSESKLLSILEATGDGILAVDKEGKKVLKANRRFAEMWRIPQSLVDAGDNRAMMDLVLEQLTDPAVFLKNESLYDSNVTTADTLDFKDGRVFERHAFPMLMDGAVVGRVWSFRDITGHKRAKAALQESEERYRALFDRSLEIVFILDFTGKILEANQAMVDKSGYKREELTTLTMASLISEDQIPLAFQTLEEIRKTGHQKKTTEFRARRKDGSPMYVETNGSIINRDGKPFAILTIVRDITEKKHAEEALRESQALYRSFFDQLPNVAFRKDREGRFVMVNSRFCQIKGAKPEDFLGKTAYEAPDSQEAIQGKRQLQSKYADVGQQVHEEIMRTGKTVETEEEHIGADGRKYFLQVVRMPVFGADGTIIGSQGIQFDITGHKRSEEAVKHERNLLRTLIDNIPDYIFVRDISNRFIVANESLARLMGAAGPSDLIGKGDADFYPPELAANFETIDQEVFADRLILNEERVLRFPNGKELTILSTKVPLKNDKGEVVGLIGIGRDITKRKRIEEAHARLATAIEQAAETVVITDAQGSILYANPAFEKTTGYTCAEAIGQNPRVLKSGKHDAEFYRRMWETLRHGEVWTGHIINKRKDGTLFEEEATISPVRDAAGKVVNYVAVKRDVTREVQLEEQIRQAQKMEVVGQLAGGVAHDFNNILAVILTQASLVQLERGLSSEQLESISEIEQAAKRAANLTRQLLLFSRRQAIQAHDLDLNQTISGLSKMLHRTITENIRIQFKYAVEPVFVRADAGMLDQVLLNLAVNARDAMPDGGQLTIGTSTVDFNELEASQLPQARPGSFACLSVTDTGCGIPPQDLPRIFEPFFTTKDIGKGTGLGLATVFGIIQQHQGWINVSSEVGRGTTFRIYLPRSSDFSLQKPNQPLSTAASGGSETILFVEDDAFVRVSVRKALTQLGYRILEAANGIEALKIWDQHRDEIKLLLTDLVMPGGLNGMELAGQLLIVKPNLKVIYASGYSANIIGKNFPQGEEFMLAKPFEMHKLAQTVRICLDKPVRRIVK